LLSAPEDYDEEAAFYTRILSEACRGMPRTLLELGSGGGNNASHMKARFDVTLVDISPGMLQVSRKLNPDCEHVEGDMRTVRLDRAFDCVFIHDAVCYITSLSDLAAVMTTAHVHCVEGGGVLFAPDHIRETFEASSRWGGHDGSDRALRYLEWAFDPDPSDTSYTVDYAYLLRHPDGSVTVEHDRHIEGLFGGDDWLRLLRSTGFEATQVPFAHSEIDRESFVFVGRKVVH